MVDLIIAISKVSPLVAAIITFSLGAVVYLKNIRNNKNRLYMSFSLIMSVWAYACYIQSTNTNIDTAIFYDKILYAVAPFAPTVFFQFISGYLNKKRNLMFLAFYMLSLVFFYINFTPYFRKGVIFLFNNRFVTIPDVGWYLYVGFFALIVALVFYDLIITFRNSYGDLKRHSEYLFIASVALAISGSSYFVLILNMAPHPYDCILNLTSSIMLTVFEIIIGYAILRYRLMDIEIVIKKGIIFSTLMTAIIGVFSFLIFLGQILFQNTLGLNQWFATILTAFIIAIGYKPLENVITEITNEYFFKKKVDYQKTLKKSSEALSLLTDIDRLIRLSTRILARDMFLEEASALIYEEAGHRYTVKAVAGRSKDLLGLTLSDNHELFNHLFTSKRILLKDEIKHTLENKMILPEERKRLTTIKKQMEKLHAQICVPAISRGKYIGSKLVAVFCIGDKKSGDMYTNDDIQLLSTLSNQAAVAVENAIMYSDLMKQFQELKETRDQLVQSEKLAALGTMAAGIAHEIRNPLTSLQLFVQMMAERFDDHEFREKFTQIVPPEIERLNRIVNDLVSFAKPSKLVREPVQINDILDKTVRLSEISFKKLNVKVVKEFSDVPKVTVDSQQMMQIFLNLIMNGAQAMPSGGTLTVKTYYHDDFNKKVCIDIKDTGVGIPEETLKKLFAPFFTTKEGGTGLGLAITRRIIEEHKGEVKVRSKVGEGTTFTVELPATQ
jgi:signal transduction histidine kinase